MFNLIIVLTLAVANAQSIAPAPAPSTGRGSGTSCADRTGPICTFDDEGCCETQGSYFTVPEIYVNVTCRQAKSRYNSIYAAGYTDQQCLSVKNDIEANAGSCCVCSKAPITPTIAPPCATTLLPTSAAYSLKPGIAILVVVAQMCK